MEKLRQLVRNFISWDHPCYRFAAKVLDLISLISSQSLKTTIDFQRMKSSSDDISAQSINFECLDYPFYIRPGTRDLSVVMNNFVRQEYGAVLPPAQPLTLVDGGAYTGDVSAYFLSLYPEIKVIALEPMDDSYELAVINLRPYGNRVDLRKCCLSSDGKPVLMSGTETGARIDRNLRGGKMVDSVTIPQLLENLQGKKIDILKLDIEGAEGEIFSAEPHRWRDRVGFLVIETHGCQNTDIVLGALQDNGWEWSRVRNLYFCKQGKTKK